MQPPFLLRRCKRGYHHQLSGLVFVSSVPSLNRYLVQYPTSFVSNILIFEPYIPATFASAHPPPSLPKVPTPYATVTGRSAQTTMSGKASGSERQANGNAQ